MEKSEIIPDISIEFENLDVDLKERLKNIIAGIQKISSKIAINRIAITLFDKQSIFEDLLAELAHDQDVEEVVVWNFDAKDFCFVVRLPESLLGHYPVYNVNDTMIFATFDRAFYFGNNMERDDQEGHNERLVYHPLFFTWKQLIKHIQDHIKHLQEEIPKD